MGTFSNIYKSSVGKKFVVGLTGLFLCTFLVVHLSINLFLFCNDGGETFNKYAEFMATNPIIRMMEIVLILGFVLHIFTSTILWYRNRRARPQKYYMYNKADISTLSSRITFITGSIIFIFLVIHMRTFWVPSRFFPAANPSMYTLVVTAFSNPTYDLLYLIALFLLGYHLRHGFESAFQTFGIKHTKYLTYIEWIGGIFWLLIPLAFASIPLYFLWRSLMGGNIS
jgi:succinate dehydrogenase / fumarate reductase, cytochrome b subunit